MSNKLIDPSAGAHFTGKIIVTPHACDRAVEHFGIKRDDAQAFIVERLRKSAFIDYVIDESGIQRKLYAYQKVVFIVSEIDSAVVTVYPQTSVNATLLTSVLGVLRKSLIAARRREVRETKRINVRIAELNVEKAQLSLRRAKTESGKVATTMNAQIAGIDAEIKRLERELIDIRREKTNLAKSIAVFI